VVAVRPLSAADLDGVAAVFADPAWARWFGSNADPAAHVDRAGRSWTEDGEAWFAICRAGDDRYLGEVGLRIEERGRANLEYWLLAEARGEGFASRAVRLVAGWALADMGLGRLQIWTEPENADSQRVALAAGFTREGVLRAYDEIAGRRVDSVFFSRLPEDL
jgi:RimJ/RimL family protein N-acetyltransferase